MQKCECENENVNAKMNANPVALIQPKEKDFFFYE